MLVAAGDGSQWQTTIDRILSWTVEERKAFLVRSMEFCRTYYSWDRVARETLRAYDLRPSGAERLARYRIFIDSCRIDSRSAAAIVCCRTRGEMLPGIQGHRRGWRCR